MALPNLANLLLSIENHVATVTLNRPEKRNAFNDEVIDELTQVFNYLSEQENVRVVILSSNGKAFCAGADLNWMRTMADYSYDENYADAEKLADMLTAIYHCSKPTIACIQGDVYAGGMGLISACDMTVAVDTANFCLSEVRLGLAPATISPYVIRAMGARAAHRYFLTGEVFDAAEAYRIGLIHECVSEAQLNETVQKLTQKLCLVSPNAASVCKTLVQDIAEQEINEDLIKRTIAGIADIRASEQGKEGVQSFLQKRKPNWIG